VLKLVCSKDLTQAIPDQTICVINPAAIAWVEIRDDWKWKPGSPHIGEPVAIIRMLVTRGDIARDRDLNRFSAHVVYVIGRERIDDLLAYLEEC
jgi:hypothetical protein